MVREVLEELGLEVAPEDLVPLPRHRQEHYHPNGIIDREYHELNMLRCDLPLEEYRPSPVEVGGIVAVPAEALADLAEGQRATLETQLVEFDSSAKARRAPLVLGPGGLVPYDWGYHRRLAERAAELLR